MLGRPGQGRARRVGATTAIDQVVHHALLAARPIALDIVFEVVGVARRHHLDLVLGQEPVKRRELLVLAGLIAASGVERVAEDDHLEFAARLLERRAEPGQLIRIDAPEHAGVDREQGKALRLDLKVGGALKSGRNSVFAAQPRGLLNQPGDAVVGGAGEPMVGLDARAQCHPGGVGDEEGGHEVLNPLNGSQKFAS
ncbi:MAG TPA: hypothetical protein VLG10_02965 [Methylomirabilota bacterium]|nr:hypothetical protein [Methylomirabilota bacterium]